MREAKAAMIETRGSFDPGGDGLMLGRLGRELAGLYRDTLQAPLPQSLRALVERLEDKLAEGEQRSSPSR